MSGHIYDRKRALAEGIDTNISQEMRPEEPSLDKRLGRDFGQRPRHLSAFSVPVRSNNMNVDGSDSYLEQTNSGKVNGTSYIMRNLKRVYENLHLGRDEMKISKDEDTKEESSDIDDDIID